MTRRQLGIRAMLSALALVAAACGSDAEGIAGPPTTTVPTTTSTTVPTTTSTTVPTTTAMFSSTTAVRTSTTRANLGDLDPDLVGEWAGNVDGSFGPSQAVMTLGADGSMSAEGDGPYCPLAGDWKVSEGKFFAFAVDDCDGTRVTFTGPLSGDSLEGTWTASSGNRGVFSFAKQ